MADDLEKIEKLFIKYKTNKLGLRGLCYDCGKQVTIKADVDDDGKLTVQEGALYFTDWGETLMKCDKCFERNHTLHRKIDVYSRVVGYMRPVDNWNIGKKEEWKNRLNVKLRKENIGG
ncbi:MAG: hypothetical protein J7K85_07910 [Anaerolineaceae bacterium]|nr:hypothetical protein [Anaerolineaceae bacterium]